MMSKLLGTYVNGNTIVAMYEDGTKVRYIRDGEKAAPEFPESMDLKITNRCDLGCPMCAECSSLEGEHANLNHPILNTINPYTELAIGGGNPLEHPDLIDFLKRMKARGVICNITVNAVHFMKHEGLIGGLAESGLIHGIGVSVPDKIPNGLVRLLKQYPGAVVHTIAGVTPMEVFEVLADHDLNLLILGYKVKGRGDDYFRNNEISVVNNIYYLEKRLAWLRKHFKAVAFDNAAVRQMNLRELLPEKDFKELYMGDDGEFTMYIDLVQKKFGKSSTHDLRPIDFGMAPAVGDLFLELHEGR